MSSGRRGSNSGKGAGGDGGGGARRGSGRGEAGGTGDDPTSFRGLGSSRGGQGSSGSGGQGSGGRGQGSSSSTAWGMPDQSLLPSGPGWSSSRGGAQRSSAGEAPPSPGRRGRGSGGQGSSSSGGQGSGGRTTWGMPGLGTPLLRDEGSGGGSGLGGAGQRSIPGQGSAISQGSNASGGRAPYTGDRLLPRPVSSAPEAQGEGTTRRRGSSGQGSSSGRRQGPGGRAGLGTAAGQFSAHRSELDTAAGRAPYTGDRLIFGDPGLSSSGTQGAARERGHTGQGSGSSGTQGTTRGRGRTGQGSGSSGTQGTTRGRGRTGQGSGSSGTQDTTRGRERTGQGSPPRARIGVSVPYRNVLEFTGTGVFAIPTSRDTAELGIPANVHSDTRIRLWSVPSNLGQGVATAQPMRPRAPRRIVRERGYVVTEGPPGEYTYPQPSQGLQVHMGVVVNPDPAPDHHNPLRVPTASWNHQGVTGDMPMYEHRRHFEESMRATIVHVGQNGAEYTMWDMTSPNQMDQLWDAYTRSREFLGIPFPDDDTEERDIDSGVID